VSGDTIFALSSGSAPSGVAIIRLSGPGVRFALETMVGHVPEPRFAKLTAIHSGPGGELLDRGIVLYFQSPNSFTGEECGEFQVHGGIAVINAVLNALGSFDGFRIAEPGEFSRRAFENGRLDLTEIEGLSDLINAKTDAQRRLALDQSRGSLRSLYEDWRSRLIFVRSMIEAELDFSDQEDVVNSEIADYRSPIVNILQELKQHLDDNRRGEIIRGGFKIALVGAPNSGKSSLINALARKDVAIVSDIAGTTRDVIEVHLDLNGYEVIVFDTAGIQNTEDQIELLGIERAIKTALAADLIVILNPVDNPNDGEFAHRFIDDGGYQPRILSVSSKSDLIEENIDSGLTYLSTIKVGGLDALVGEISTVIKDLILSSHDTLLSRARHREYLTKTAVHLERALPVESIEIEIASEHLRLASQELGKIVGRVDVEDLLDVIFAEFCVGK